MTDSAKHNNVALDIKQDSLIAHAQAIHGFGFVQAFDVAMKSVFRSFDLAKNLGAFA